MEEIPRFPLDPFVSICVLFQTLYLTGENKKVLCIRVTVKWYKDTGWYDAFQQTKVTLLVIRRGQKLHRWPKDVENHTRRGIFSNIHLFLLIFVFRSDR